MRKKPREKPQRTRWKKSKLEDLINRATVDASNDEEEQLGFFTAIEDHVKFPFKVTLLGAEVSVRGIEVNDADIRVEPDYLERVIMRITYVGAGFLAIVAIIPSLLSSAMEVNYTVASFYGGTGLLIVISVALDRHQ